MRSCGWRVFVQERRLVVLHTHSRLDESGQTMSEYAVTLGIITLAAVIGFTMIGNTLAAVISSVVSVM